MKWLEWLIYAIWIAILGCIMWHGITIKVGNIMEVHSNPLSRLFNKKKGDEL